MPDPTDEDWYRLLTTALLAVASRPFSDVLGVALGLRGVTLLLENSKNRDEIARGIEERFGISPALRTIGPIQPIAQGGDEVYAQRSALRGTLGCTVKDANNIMYFLTCDHVVGVIAGQNVGDQVYSPHGNRVGVFAKGGTVTISATFQNRVDAALVQLDQPGTHLRGIQSIGNLSGTNSSITYGDRTEKYGANTKLTRGDYVYKVSHLVPYANGSALFVDQIGIDSIHPSPFADPGNSGSVVVDNNGSAVGMVFAAAVNSNLGFANPINEVLQTLGVYIV